MTRLRGVEAAGAPMPRLHHSLAGLPSVDPRSVRGVYFFPDRLPFEDGAAASGAGWDGMIPLRAAEIRQRSRLSYVVSRSVRRGQGRRHLAVIGLVAACALMAACASAVRSVPDSRAISVAATETSYPLPRSVPALRGGRPASRVSVARLKQAREAPQVEATSVEATSVEAPQVEAPQQTMQDPTAQSEAGPQPGSVAIAPDVGATPAQEGFGSFLRRDATPESSVTQLVAFRSAPFPYDGAAPGGGAFFNVDQDGRRGHRGRRGQVLWESKTFSDNRVLVHVPAHFDAERPGVMVLFLHGYGATLARDVGARQQVPQQVSASGANAVLVAPQFAKDARDPSIGRFWQPGGFRSFLHESAVQLARASGRPDAVERFEHMPIVIVAYSGGFYPGAWCLKDIAGSHRVRGILMLDAAYGEFERYADWAAANRSSFLVSSYTPYTARQNGGLRSLLAARGVPIRNLSDSLAHGGATFFAADHPHNDYVTQAWTDDPIRDLLARMPELHLRDPQAVASMDLSATASIH